MDGLNEGVRVINDVVTDPQYSDLSFLGHPHTAKHCRKQAYKPDIFSTGMLSRWMAGKRESVLEKAEKKVKEILKERKETVSSDIKKELLRLALE